MRKLAITAALLLMMFAWATGCAATRLAQPSPPSPPEAGAASFGRGGAAGEPKAALETAAVKEADTPTGDRMVIHTARLSLEVDSLTQSLDAIARLARDAGGYLASASREGRSTSATVDLRVPATAYEDTLSRLRRLAAKVLQESSSAKDVGEEFSDLSAQLRNLEAVEAQYRELLRRAQTIDEILKVQQYLNEVRGRIERTQGRLGYLERQAEMAAITVGLSETPPPPIPWDPAQAVREAWETSLTLGRLAASYLLWALVFSWWLPLPLLVASLLWRRHRRSPAPTS